MTTKRLRADKLNEWIQALMDSGQRVVAPVRAEGKTLFSAVANPADIVLDEGITLKSAKGVFFPQSEAVLKFASQHGKTQVENAKISDPQTVLLGVRPCDAASLEILDAVFSWDYKDPFYLERRKNTTIVTLGCSKPVDEYCFCTSVGLAPMSRSGADLFIMKHPDGFLALEALTEKGEALLSQTASLLEDSSPIPSGDGSETMPPKFALEKIKPWLDEHFEDPFWKEMSLKCIGCGTCTFLCPTCHCFDIVDETRLEQGVRRKNWDSCQFSLFTLHASGHNPRKLQSERYRQRIMHKFKYYVEKFDRTLCVGCGRCVRSCPVGHSLLDYLTGIVSSF